MTNNKRVTLKDISEHLGVSVTTIYKALNDKPKVGDELRENILRTAKEMGYVPNRVAQALVRDPLTIAAVIPKYPREFMVYVEKGVQAALEELRDYNVEGIVEVVPTAEQADKVWKQFYDKGVSGIVSCFGECNDGISALMKEMPGFNIPVVSIITAPRDDTPYIGEVVSSGKVLGRMAGQLMGMICKPQTPVACFLPDMSANIHAQCAQAFSEESKLKGLDCRGVYFAGYNRDKDRAYKVTRELLESCPDIGGIYVASSNACNVCECVYDFGLSGKINIIGHDLYPKLAEWLSNGTLTATLFQNQYGNAYKGVMTLFEYLAGAQKSFNSIYYRPELVMQANLDIYQDMY